MCVWDRNSIKKRGGRTDLSLVLLIVAVLVAEAVLQQAAF